MELGLGSHQFIHPAPCNSSAPLQQVQVDAWVMAVQHLRHAALRKCRVPSLDRLPTNAWVQVVQLTQYDLFLAVSRASGLVCADLAVVDPLFQAIHPGRQHAAIGEALVATATLPQLRQWVHFLVCSEQEAGGRSSPVVDALRNGRLMAVAHRLAHDPIFRP